MDVEQLKLLGYSNVRQLPDGRWIGTTNLLFTTALYVGLDDVGYAGRYCYEHHFEAVAAAVVWDGSGHPPGRWIVRKGFREPDLVNIAQV